MSRSAAVFAIGIAGTCDVVNQWLTIYIRDHHAASAGGVALARRALGPHHPIAAEIARDREALEYVMRQLEIEPSALKVGFVRLAERLGRLKLNGTLFKRSPMSHIVELEMLVVGIRGKEALWSALATADVQLRGVGLDDLLDSARAQALAVDELRLSAAAVSFAGSARSQEPLRDGGLGTIGRD